MHWTDWGNDYFYMPTREDREARFAELRRKANEHQKSVRAARPIIVR